MVSVLGKPKLWIILKSLNRSRWEGTFPTNTGIQGCANGTDCSCIDANANASDYSDVYKLFLNNFFVSQVTSLKYRLTLFRQRALRVPGDGSIGKIFHLNY